MSEPETCPYTGQRLHCFPLENVSGPPSLMGYFREETAYLFKCRRITPEELAWIVANPGPFTVERSKFQAWRDRLRAATSEP